MSDTSDFGYSKIEWEKTNRENVTQVEAEYRQRFEGTLAGQADLDKKAQYILTGLITLVSALLGLAFFQAKTNRPYVSPAYASKSMRTLLSATKPRTRRNRAGSNSP